MWKHHYLLIKNLHSFSLPLVFNQFFNSLIALFLARITGHISINAIAITNMVDLLIFSLLGILGAGTLSFNIYSSQIKDSNKSAFNDFFHSIIELNLIIGLFSILFIWLSMSFILSHFFHLAGTLLLLGKKYTFIVSFKLFFSMLIFAFSNQLKVYKKTRAIFLIGVFSSLFQVFMAYILTTYIFSGDNRVLGIALASTITVCLTLICHIVLIKKELIMLLHTASTKKKFLFVKSIPLFIQELIEGTFLSLLITSLLSQSGTLLYSSYVLCKYLTELALTPMFMYCHGLIIFIGEKTANKKQQDLLILPKLTLVIILTLYLFLIALMLLTHGRLFSFFSTNYKLIQLASHYFPLIILVEGSRPFYEVYKYSLQALGFESLALMITAISVMILSFLFIYLTLINSLHFLTILILLGVFNLIVSWLFSYFYKKKLPLSI